MILDDRYRIHTRQRRQGMINNNHFFRLYNYIIFELPENRILYKDIAEVSTSPLNIQICSWNIGSTKPEALDSSGAPSIRFLHNWLREVPDADIIVVGLQEVVDLESKKVIGKSFLKRANAQTSPEAKQEMRYQLWQDRLTRVLRETSGGSEGGPSYRLLMRQSLVGLFLCVFIKDSLPPRVTGTAATVVKTGLGGYHGNKVKWSSFHVHLAIIRTEDVNKYVSLLLDYREVWHFA